MQSIVCAVLGSVLLTRSNETGADEGPRTGMWLPWSAAVLRALAQVLSKAGLVLWPNPFAAALIGYTVSAAVVWAAPALDRRRKAFAINRSGSAWFALTGVLNGSAVLAMYYALSAGPVYIVSPIVATYPLFTLVLSALVLRRERLSGALIAGVALTVAGVLVLLVQW